MSSYVRPAVAEQTYLDEDGAVIEYGNRWGSEGPAPDSYSVDTHPERFAPLHTIAAALIDYLQRDYAVEVTEDLSCVQDLRRPRVADAQRAVRVTPAAADAAALTFVFTGYPGVIVHAGLLHDFLYPVCGCDACDETWQSVAAELEWNVQAVVSGGYREAFSAASTHHGSRTSCGRRTARATSVALRMRPPTPASTCAPPRHN